MREGCPPAVGLAKASAPTAFHVGLPSEGSIRNGRGKGTPLTLAMGAFLLKLWLPQSQL